MNQPFKTFLQRLHIYHPLQGFYRGLLFKYQRNKTRRLYQHFQGTGFTCNVCGASYQQFVPDLPRGENEAALAKHKVIAGYGENVLCPNCLSTARERLVIAMLTEHDLDGKQVLHLSPEKNIYNFLRNKARVVTADLLPGFYKTIDGLVQKQDATQFSFPGASFDWVIGNHILEHIPADQQAMNEIFRVLKPGGSAILQVPYSELRDSTIEEVTIKDPVKQSMLFGQKDHVRIYALSDYVHRLEQAGFEVEVLPYEALQKYYSLAIQPGEAFLKIQKPVTS
jgi:SAM-dependent methyltransferase